MDESGGCAEWLASIGEAWTVLPVGDMWQNILYMCLGEARRREASPTIPREVRSGRGRTASGAWATWRAAHPPLRLFARQCGRFVQGALPVSRVGLPASTRLRPPLYPHTCGEGTCQEWTGGALESLPISASLALPLLKLLGGHPRSGKAGPSGFGRAARRGKFHMARRVPNVSWRRTGTGIETCQHSLWSGNET